MRTHEAGVCLFVPPFILESIVQNGTREEQQAAAATLLVDSSVRIAREVADAAADRTTEDDTAAPPKNRRVSSANNGTDLPGTLQRGEGDPATGDAAVDEAYDGLGGTFDLLWEAFGRNSIDDKGMDLNATVHYGKQYNNAFWDGTRMVFGDGDGVIFNRFTIAPDVEGHELAHGVIGATAGLEYRNQSGALNESIADCIGAMVKQRMLGQTSEQADWIIGAGLLTSGINGQALRSMKAPGTAFDDPKLGKDPQPDHMDKFVETTADYGGVHINSGIPNRAFYLAAIALGGHSWERAGKIWYETLIDSRLSSTATFIEFATLTADNANTLFGDSVRDVIIAAWRDVGLEVENVLTWHYTKDVLSTYTSAHSKNAWAFIQDLGWRRIQPLSADGVTNMFTLLTHAQAAGRKVHVYTDQTFIHEVYAV